MHSLPSGHCVCQVDLHHLAEELNLLIDWKFSLDLGELMLLLKDWVMIHVTVKNYACQFPLCFRPRELDGHGRVFHQMYHSLSLCHYEDVSWKQEVVNRHVVLSGGLEKRHKVAGLSATAGQPVGFKIRKKQTQKDASSVPSPTPWKSTLQLEECERKNNWRLEFMEASRGVLTLVLSRESAFQGDWTKKAICFASFEDHSVHLHQ